MDLKGQIQGCRGTVAAAARLEQTGRNFNEDADRQSFQEARAADQKLKQMSFFGH
ncbi:MAG: hypothetical protein NZ959_09435 [Armatimonadetes bacterium]|nr:hypothetical protein [Armatimonadota bacterium]MDW8122191.1 hypothetical protein [Armatimonadota bacterium]